LLPLVEQDLSPADRGLCHQLTLGTLRRQIKLDRIIDSLAKGKLDTAVRVALRLGLYQLLYLDKIPPHSAINESVNLAAYAKKTSAKGFINAILRRSTRENTQLKYADDIERIVVETSHPRVLVERWLRQFGMEKTEAICEANNAIPPIAFRRTARECSLDLSNFAASKITEGAFTADGNSPELLAAAERGEIYFQDEGSQMIANAVELSAGGRFFDVCAAPGGKTGSVALRAGLVVCGDVHFERVRFLKENLERQGIKKASVLRYDAAKSLPFAADTFDAVLVDAPCSGTGTIRHNPELRYFFEETEIEPLFAKQLAILENASKTVRIGGLLVYSTCSLEMEENEDVCQRFLAENGDIEQINPNVPEGLITDEGFGRTFPEKGGSDGFFIAAFRKTGTRS
jgi:16S rRNA (cytosine967-C5)-methyltransferase